MKIQIITDAWFPQVNGVVTTLSDIVNKLEFVGDEVDIIEPSRFKTIGCPTYKEIQLAYNLWAIPKMIKEFNADAIHIATSEGPIGRIAAMYCSKKQIPFTTSYHTKIPEYVHKRFPIIPTKLGYWYMRQGHKHAKRILVTTPGMKQELESWGFEKLVVWTRGVNIQLFNPENRDDTTFHAFPRPVMLYVGRLSIEKSIEDLINIETPGTIVLVGDGPQKEELERIADSKVWFAGVKQGEQLAKIYANADVFVFPSKTDTFGVVMLEAMASGTPTAAYPVTGPNDIIEEGVNGSLNDNLAVAIENALKCDRTKCAESSKQYNWDNVVEIFRSNLFVTKSM